MIILLILSTILGSLLMGYSILLANQIGNKTGMIDSEEITVTLLVGLFGTLLFVVDIAELLI